MEEKRYYLPVSSVSLAHYFGSACIKPGKYFQNKPEDLQDKFKDFLFVTTHRGIQQTDCCLELVFTLQEQKELIDITNGFFLFEKPLPVTRVKKIFFTDKAQKEQTIANVNMSTAFIPDELIEIVEKFETVSLDRVETPSDINVSSFENQVKTFDRYLGGFALMRLAGEEYMNYSENYFATLSFFNVLIEKELQRSKGDIDPRYQGAFTGKGFERILPYLNKTVNEDVVRDIAAEEGQRLYKDKITRVIDFTNLDRWTYTLVVLNTYGVGNESKKKRVDELILSNFKSGIKQGKSEGIALCYGLNRGYSVFSNKYGLADKKKNVKFKLDSKLDYYTIESIYQYVFNGSRPAEFPYLEWCPKIGNVGKLKKSEYRILDVIVIGKKKDKVCSTVYLDNLLLQFFQKDSIAFFRGLFEKVREVIYTDVKEEITEEYEQQIALKQAEIDSLKARINELLMSRKESEAGKICLGQQPEELSPRGVQQQILLPPSTGEIRRIVEETLNYKKDKELREKKATEMGISKKLKQDEVIIQIMTTRDNHIKFPEQ